MAKATLASWPARRKTAMKQPEVKKQKTVRMQLSSKDREIQRYLRKGAVGKALKTLYERPDEPTPMMSDLSSTTLERLADHCETKGIGFTFHGMRIV